MAARSTARRCPSPVTSRTPASRPLGPCITTRDEIGDPEQLDVKLWVSGELRPNYNTSDLAHSIAESIAWATAITPVQPGDVLYMGTNHQGLGALQDGDHVDMEITNIGRLSFDVGRPAEAPLAARRRRGHRRRHPQRHRRPRLKGTPAQLTLEAWWVRNSASGRRLGYDCEVRVQAGVAQSAERNFPKVEVAGSNPVPRSTQGPSFRRGRDCPSPFGTELRFAVSGRGAHAGGQRAAASCGRGGGGTGRPLLLFTAKFGGRLFLIRMRRRAFAETDAPGALATEASSAGRLGLLFGVFFCRQGFQGGFLDAYFEIGGDGFGLLFVVVVGVGVLFVFFFHLVAQHALAGIGAQAAGFGGGATDGTTDG